MSNWFWWVGIALAIPLLVGIWRRQAGREGGAAAAREGAVTPPAPGDQVSAAQVAAELAAGSTALIIDVREPHEYARGHIPGARLRPLGQLHQWAGELDRKAEIILVCRSGNRSNQALRILQAQGFARARNMQGGMLAWPGKVSTDR